jgi:hypothetical protein
MKIEQRMVIKIVDFEIENDDIETYQGLEEASENDLLSPEEQGFMLGYIGA